MHACDKVCTCVHVHVSAYACVCLRICGVHVCAQLLSLTPVTKFRVAIKHQVATTLYVIVFSHTFCTCCIVKISKVRFYSPELYKNANI